MSIKNALASVAVKDLNAAVRWYEKLLGRPADSRPMAELAEWKFERGGWLQVYQGTERIGLCSVTLAVDEIEEERSSLARLGIPAGEPVRSANVNVLMIKDPDGNSIAFAQALTSTIAQ